MSEAEETWHSHYDDPLDDLVLVSTDHVLFRVSSHRMAKVSLPDPASNIVENIKKTHSTIPKPSPRIQTEQSSGTIERFLGLVYVPNGDTQIGTFNDDQLLCLLKFTRQIGSTQLYTKLLTSFRGCSFSRPVEVIDYAIDREDWEMARQGMTLISNPSYQFYKRESFGAWLESKPEAWQVAIMRALLYKSGTDNVPDHWGSCADGLMRPPDMKRKDAPEEPQEATLSKSRKTGDVEVEM